jgi:putative DNA primase/helicase
LVGGFPWTDSGNAERVIALEGSNLLYVPAWGKWNGWTAQRWELDDGAPFRAAKRTMRELLKQANGIEDDDRRKAALAFATRSESLKALHAMVSLARHETAVVARHDAFDADRMLFNVSNGTVDLRTNELRKHRREDFITKISPIHYDSKATCPRFEAFVLEIMGGDAELAEFLHRYLGYCLSGDVREHLLAFWYGLGCNGKSLLVLILLFVFGDYAAKAAPDLLFRSEHTDRHPTELCDLHGRRLIVCNETTRGRSWDEGTLKDVTGGDRLRARRMREDFWEWDPTHKIIVFGNHKPQIKTVDDALRRRLRLVPFGVNFEKTRDPGLFDKLKAEAPGILRWLVEGCIAWQKHGISDAKRIFDATNDYMRDEDILGQFFAHRCIFKANEKISRKELRDCYVKWSDERDEKPVSAKEFTSAVRKRGAVDRSVRTAASTRPVDGWIGVRLATEVEQATATAWGERSDVVTSSDQNPYSARARAIVPLTGNSSQQVTTSLQDDVEDEDETESFFGWLKSEGIAP